MSVSTRPAGIREALGSNEDSLAMMMRALRKFDSSFVNAINIGSDFTISIEARGNKGRLLHVRTRTEEIERPQDCGKNGECV